MIELIQEPIDTNRILASVTDPECGAQVLFVGTTRQWTQHGDGVRETEFLVYDAYGEMAVSQMQQLEVQAREKWPLRKVALVHRLGRVGPTEPSVAVAVSSPHRREAFEAAKWLIDELKHHVPIWKQEHFVQSGPEWIHPTNGSCNCEPSGPLNQSATAIAANANASSASLEEVQQQTQQ